MNTFAPLAQQYLETTWQLDPVGATSLGISDYDHLLTDFSPAGRENGRTWRQALLTQFEDLDPSELTSSQHIDWIIIMAELRDSLAEFELHAPQRAPYLYTETLGQALSSIMDRTTAPTVEQAESLLARLRLARPFLEQARENLDYPSVPALWNRLAQIGTTGLLLFLKDAVPAYAESTPLAHALQTAAADAHQAARAFQDHLDEKHSQANGHFPVGEDFFNHRLRTMFMVDMDAQALYEFGQEQLDRAQQALREVARDIDPTRSWEELLEDIKADHPTAEQLLASYAYEIQQAEAFVREKDLVSIPDGAECSVAPIPAYLRATTPLGDMSTTAPFAPGLRSTLRITPVDTSAPPNRQEEHLRDSNYAFQRAIALHEAYPGHHLQLVHHKLFPSDVRKSFTTPLFVEGWGLYTEELMRETGFLNTPSLHLMQLKNVLWRAARVVVDTGLHTRGLSYEDALQFMMDTVRMERHMAQGEVSRYTTHHSATYTSSYLLGKHLIMDLREDYRTQMGQDFSLKDFHDRLLSYGSIPVPLLRELLLS